MKLFRGARHAAETLAAFDKSQAMIEFSPDGRVTAVNENFLRALGYERSEVLGQHHALFLDPAQRDSAEYRDFWPSLARGAFKAGEFRRIGKGGREVWIQASYNPVFAGSKLVKIVKIASDITLEKLRAADAEGQIEAIGRVQAIIQFKLDGTILDANDNFLRALGYAREDIVGKHHAMFVDPAFAASDAYRQFWSDLAGGAFKADEFRRIGKGGRDVWIQASYNPIFDANGQPFKVVKFATDITASVLRRQQREAAAQDIDAELGEVAKAIQETDARAASAAAAATQTSTTVQAVAAGAEQLAGSVQEISRQVVSAMNMSNDAVSQAGEADRIVNGLAEAAQKIGEITALISGIATQTNLLALNATIEAARAGDAGRGFAVVANEVKALADQTGRATGEIAAQIQGVQSSTRGAVSAIGSIAETIQRLNEISSGIATAVEEQTAVTREIAENMQVASTGVNEISRNITSISAATNQVASSANSVRDMSRASAAA
ncbi:methyl-accepting chemotaxis protein [Rhodoblastus acidophilus]|uniref:methyl-accepting chemotaxis protein n=1 Tax=Rhodoblastus acidophilus TaxID=1074 RepID=UPI002223EF42|nr:PAS domain-containing methyl-accepting chemotaxis protein [Rhodoblastus acidophilus]MCW2282524.1 methyl-accepting chemotaxis protein [Rhodoblastus acidophilus]MCW2331385.1 methyl-accepting chemotaxis protein [Rhodoblastus acidophilus]